MFTIGQDVRVAGLRGTFRVTGFGKDASVTLWGGPRGAYSFRAVMPERCRRIRKGGPERIPAMAAPARRAGAR